MTAYSSMIGRLTNIPLSLEKFKKELDIIKQMATNNSYLHQNVSNILNKNLYKTALVEVYNQNKKFCSVSYLGHTIVV